MNNLVGKELEVYFFVVNNDTIFYMNLLYIHQLLNDAMALHNFSCL